MFGHVHPAGSRTSLTRVFVLAHSEDLLTHLLRVELLPHFFGLVLFPIAGCLVVCFEVMLSVVSLPNHTFTGQD